MQLFLSDVGEVPEAQRTAVVDVACDEGGTGEEMELAYPVDHCFGFKCRFRICGIKVDRKRLCPDETDG